VPHTRHIRFLTGMLGTMALVLCTLYATGRIATTGPGCSEGLDKPASWAHIRHEYGLGVPAITVATDGCFEQRQTQVIWHSGGLVLLGILLAGNGLLGGWVSVWWRARRRYFESPTKT
jgi:hypothetical protein